jgi:hypothetical protein
MTAPINTIARCAVAHLFKDGPRYYIESNAGKDYQRKVIKKTLVDEFLHTAKVLRWTQDDKNIWLNSNYKKHLKK